MLLVPSGCYLLQRHSQGSQQASRHVPDHMGRDRKKHTRYLHTEEKKEDSQPLSCPVPLLPSKSGMGLECVITAYRAN